MKWKIRQHNTYLKQQEYNRQITFVGYFFIHTLQAYNTFKNVHTTHYNDNTL